MLQVKSLFLKLPKFALKAISFEVESGQTHIIMGKTGSGKTLLLETIVGFNPIQKGEIHINKQDCTLLAVQNRNIAYLPQDLALFPHLNVEQNILYAPKIKNSLPSNLTFSKQLIQVTGIGHLLKRKIKNLSGGEKQRVALVRALMTRSKLLLLDEPFSALDQNTKQELYILLKKLQQEFYLTILAVTHDLEEAFFLADTISVMSEGEILQTARKKELYQNPKSAEIASFLDVDNIFEAVVEQINENSMRVFSEELNFKTTINSSEKAKKYLENQSIKLGFRKGNISIVMDNQITKNAIEHKITGKIVLIIQKIATYQILLEMQNSASRILIEISGATFEKSKLKLQEELTFCIQPQDILLFEA